MNPAALPAVTGQQTVTGAMQFTDVMELRKALEAGYGTDVATLTGGGALRIQSLEKTMLATIQENKHFALFNALAKANATATVDEWTEQSSVGGFPGGSTNTETGNISQAVGEYQRRVGMVKYLMTRREVSFVQTLQNAIVESEATEASNGALQLLSDAEYLSFEGDSTVVPTEFDGIDALITGLGSGDHVIDVEGGSLSSIHLVNQAARTIAGYGNFGTPTHLFMSQTTQADFDNNLDPAFRVPLTDLPGGGIQIGAPVVGIRTSWGNIKNVPDVFVRDELQQLPFQVMFPSVAAANTFAPATVTPDASVTDVTSKWGTPHAGNYYWGVAGVNNAGQSAVVLTGQIAVAAGKKVSLTIAASVTGAETGYAIYRGRLNGTNALTDLRFVCRIARTGASTVFVDYNRLLPGTAKAYMLNMTSGQLAITWRSLLPMLKFPLYPTVSAVVPWAQLMFGYLRIGKRKHHVVFKNIVPAGQLWKPFL